MVERGGGFFSGGIFHIGIQRRFFVFLLFDLTNRIGEHRTQHGRKNVRKRQKVIILGKFQKRGGKAVLFQKRSPVFLVLDPYRKPGATGKGIFFNIFYLQCGRESVQHNASASIKRLFPNACETLR